MPAFPVMPTLVSGPFRVLALLASLMLATLASAAPSDNPAEALVSRSLDAMRSDPDASRRHAEAALKLLVDHPDADLELRARVLLCDYFSERDPQQATLQVATAQPLVARVKRRGLQAGLFSCEGEIEENAGNNAHALMLYDQAVAAADSAADGEMLGNALYERGYLRGVQGDYASGMADLQRARATFDRIDMPMRSVTVFNGIASLYNRMGDHEQARHYYEQSLKAQQQDGSRREIAVTQHNLGRVYENLGEWDKARTAFETTLNLSREIDYPRGEAYALRGLASVRNAEGEPDAALGLLRLADSLQQQRVPDLRLHAQILLQRGIALRGLKRPAEAQASLREALGVFAKVDSLQELVATQKELAEADADVGDWKAAHDDSQAYAQTLERWLRGQLDQRFATLKIEFDTVAKEKQNALLLRENAATDNALAQAHRASRLQVLVICLAGALLLMLAVLMFYQRRHGRLMSRLAFTDELTSLPNRRDVLSRLQNVLAERHARPCALLILDLDHFKAVNDDFGHLVGDEMLKAVAVVLRDAVKPPAFVGRLGGEEFIVVMPNADEERALAQGEHIRARVQALDAGPWMPGGRSLTASLGVALSRPGEDTVTSLLHRADEALYSAKAAGRNRVFARAA